MIHLCGNPPEAEVDHGPPLFYHLPARRPGILRPGRRRPRALPLLAGRLLPPLPRTVPKGLRLWLCPQGRAHLRQDRHPPAPRPPEVHRRVVLRPPLLRAALHGRPDRRRPGAAVPALLRRALLG